MGTLLIWIIVIFLLYKFWQLGHWFLFVNVDEKGQEHIFWHVELCKDEHFEFTFDDAHEHH